MVSWHQISGISEKPEYLSLKGDENGKKKESRRFLFYMANWEALPFQYQIAVGFYQQEWWAFDLSLLCGLAMYG
ncbi:hypothetical protein KKB83_04400 [Patescibacteria group bacterium]|nr:hypothetical protein [Patescibacteria group bacterium]